MKLIPLDQVKHLIKVGAPIPYGVRDASGLLLLARGVVLNEEELRAQLLDRGAFVDADEVKRLTGGELKAPPESLWGSWETLRSKLDRLLHFPPATGMATAADELAMMLFTLVNRDTDAAIFLTVRPGPEWAASYGVAHSVHTAKVSLLIARRLGWGPEQLRALLKAALTMNIAIVDLQTRLTEQERPLTALNKQAIREHPAKGVEMLRAAGVTDAQWLALVAEHHELPDGSGYPAGIRTVSEAAQVLHFADDFTARLRPRAHRSALPPPEAAKALWSEHSGNPIMATLIKEFGIYPPGCLVKLKSGEGAVVVRRSEQANCPIVASLVNKSGIKHEPVRRDTSLPDYTIVGTLPESAVPVRLLASDLYGPSRVAG